MNGTIIMRYIGLRFLRNVIGVYFVCAGLIFVVESIENLRRASVRDVGADIVFTRALYRTPVLAEQVLPFSVLIGAILTYLMLSRSSELAVARAAGMSAWQFLLPALVIAAVLGVFSACVYNPVAAVLSREHETMSFDAFIGSGGRTVSKPVWLRQQSVDGPAVIHADDSAEGGTRLRNVTAYVYAPDESFVERVEAPSARLESGRWVLEDASTFRPNQQMQKSPTYFLSTYLTPEQTKTLTTSADSVSFWDLGETIEINEKSGLSTEKLRYEYQSLLARPILFTVMVVIAATVSLGIFRSGQIGRMIISGIGAGFVFYVTLKIVGDLGSVGVLNPALSAWGPILIALLLGTRMLLVQEDG